MSTRDDLKLADRVAQIESQRGFLGYLDHYTLNAVPPRPFREVADEWQWEDYRRFAPAQGAVAGISPPLPDTEPRWFWRGRPRGHDKTSGLARMYLWLLAYSKRPQSMSHIAADWDQARQLQEVMAAEMALNPWIKGVVIKRGEASGPGGRLRILGADAASNFGLLDDVVSCDEVTHWLHANGQAVWDAVVSGISKRPLAVLVVLTNAGVLDSWQHAARNLAATSRMWDFEEVPPNTHLASWMDPGRIAEMAKLLTPSEARRVLGNVWIDASEDCGYLTREEVMACQTLGDTSGLGYRIAGIPGVRYYAGIDYAPKRDRTALVILHRDQETGLVIVDRLDMLQAPKIAQVEQWIRDMDVAFNVPDLVVDPYQMKGTIEEFEGSHRVIEFEARGGKANYEMAECQRGLVVNRQIAWYAGCGALPTKGAMETLTDEMAGLITKRMVYGYRFDHEAGKHDDRTVAVGMAALQATQDEAPAWVPPERMETPKQPQLDRQRPQRASRDGGKRRGLWGM